MSSRLTFSVLLVFLIPMLVPASISPISVVVAESNCDDGEFVPPNWNKTVERLAKIPTVFDYDNEYADDRDRRDGKEDDDDDDQPQVVLEYDGPEESWMTWEPNNNLNLLRDDFSTVVSIGNDAVGTLRVNLDHERRTTICVNIVSENTSFDPKADVYLLTDTQYDRYTAAYDVAHGAWGWGGFDDDDDLGDVSPEWRSFNIAGWNTFRDVHQYEKINEVSFSVSLDGPEISSGLFGDNSKQYFNIVIDNTNNSHRNDAIPQTSIDAIVTIVSEERTTILPNWTVSVVCCGVMIATLFIPAVMNKKYMSSGLSLTAENQQIEKGLVPSLEQNRPD